MTKLFITTLASWLLLITGSIAAAQITRAGVADTPIRQAPNLASAIIATLREGEPIDVVDVEGDWFRVLVPHQQGRAVVGYVMAHLIEIVNKEGSAQSIQMPATGRSERPVVQGRAIPPTLVQPAQAPVERESRDKGSAREQELKARVDALKAEVDES